MENLAKYTLGITEQPIKLSTSDETRDVTLSMVSQGKSTLEIFSRDLDAPLYNTQDFCDVASQLARNNKYSRIRILVQDPIPAVNQGHRLIQLSRRLSSSVEIRKISQEYSHHNQAFLVVDKRAYVFRELADRYEGSASFNDPNRTLELSNYFRDVWHHSLDSPELRRLSI